MQLPECVRNAVDERAAAVGFPQLRRAAQAMSTAYRQDHAAPTAGLLPAERVAAYLATRMPATYAAAHAVICELEDCSITSLLDVGAGAGAASLAAQSWFPMLEAITLIERDNELAGVARGLLPKAQIRVENFLRLAQFPPHDLVIAAYSLGESRAPALVERLWRSAGVALVIIEPGTPRGFALVREARDSLLAAGAHMLAPCPAATPCPLDDPDWCHFAARVERTSLHRRLKGGELSYEDEKFSYIAVGRQPRHLALSRIIRRPRHQPGLIALEACTPRGIESLRVSKRDRERFRAARRAAWGDAFPPL